MWDYRCRCDRVNTANMTGCVLRGDGGVGGRWVACDFAMGGQLVVASGRTWSVNFHAGATNWVRIALLPQAWKSSWGVKLAPSQALLPCEVQ